MTNVLIISDEALLAQAIAEKIKLNNLTVSIIRSSSVSNLDNEISACDYVLTINLNSKLKPYNNTSKKFLQVTGLLNQEANNFQIYLGDLNPIIALHSIKNNIYISDLNYCADFITRQLFSYSLTQNILLADVFKQTELQSKFPNTKLINCKLPFPQNIYIESTKLTLNDLIFLVKAKKIKYYVKTNQVKSHKLPQIPHFPFKIIYYPLLLFIWVVSFPFILILISLVFSFISFQSIKSGQFNSAKYSYRAATTFANAGSNGFNLISIFPVPNHFKYYQGLANNYYQGLLLADNIFVLKEDFSKLISIIFNKSDEDFNKISKKFALEANSIYQDSQFLEGNLKNLDINQILGISFDQYNHYSNNSLYLLNNLGLLLGETEPVKYLVLFQNNMELRPTGGYIGSYGILSFENGRFIDLEIYDIFSADGQIKGYIKPPSPIEKYLDEPSWFFRDSNWDPDFIHSAERAQWFLDKSMNQKVNGVIAVNLNFIQDLLAITGPIQIIDYNDTVDSKNFYEKLQAQVEDDFFPGSHQKKTYLSAFSISLLTELTSLSSDQQINVAKALLSNLTSREVQLFHNNPTINQVFDNLNWSGKINFHPCSNNCLSLDHALIEANLGINKANYFITRQAQYYIDIKDNYIQNSLSVEIKNSASVESDLKKSTYSNYLRLLLPSLARIEAIYINDQEIQDFENQALADYQEIGLFTKILPGESQVITFRWAIDYKLDFSNFPKLLLNIRKQSGVLPYPLQIYVKPLTLSEYIRYNTTLSADLVNFNILP